MADTDIKVVGLSNIKSSGKTNWKVISAIVGIIVLSVGVVAGIMLVRQNQNINEEASCEAMCPDGDTLRSCHDQAESGEGDTLDSICTAAGRVEICGQTAASARQYCCPSAGGNWTTNLTLCSAASTATATATATSTSSATATSTSTSNSTATATATSSGNKTATATSTSKATKTATAKATATGSSFPVPETGADWPTMLGAGFGVIMILVSLALAL